MKYPGPVRACVDCVPRTARRIARALAPSPV